MSKDLLDIAVAMLEKVATNKKIGKFICGEYRDGSVRSMADAIKGEIISPDEKKKKNKKKHSKKKKKGKKKKGNKSIKKSTDFFYF